MSGAEIVFYLLGGLAVGSALLVVSSRNPVASLLFLVLCFFCLAGLFVTLEAHFLAAIQILVYAGAILVLFLFVIMLLNLGVPEELRMRLPRAPVLALSMAAGAGFVLLLGLVIRDAAAPAIEGGAAPAAVGEGAPRSIGVAPGDEAAVQAAADAADDVDTAARDEVGADALGADVDPPRVVGTTEAVGVALFRDFLLPFEVTSLLLLVAMVGAVMLAKRER